MSKKENEEVLKQLNEQWGEEPGKDFQLYKNVESNHNEVKNKKPHYINVPNNMRKKSN